MNRETFKMSEIKNEEVYSLFFGENLYINNDYQNDRCEYEFIEDEITYIDYGKGYSKVILTFKRCIDNKYFQVGYTRYQDGVYENLEDLEAEEVFKKEIITYIYE